MTRCGGTPRSGGFERGAATAEAFVPLSFALGEVYQFDWSHEVVLIGATTVTVKVAHIRLCHSRMLFVRANPCETKQMVFEAHNRAFGVAQRGNMIQPRATDDFPAIRARMEELPARGRTVR
jgi:hypothetical protein